jgi:hypothetical protein
MSCEEFLNKWTFIPPIRYAFGIYSIDAFYVTSLIKKENENLSQLLLEIDAQLEEGKK